MSRLHAILPRLALILGLPGVVVMVFAVLWATQPYVPPAGSDIFTLVEGRWAWTTHEQGCDSESHRIAFSPDRTIMTIISSPPYKDENGEWDSVAVYDIRQITRSSIRGAIRGETRLTDDGVPVVWDLVLRSADRYAWHRTDWTYGAYTPEIARCP